MEITVPQMFHQHNYPRNEYRSPTPLKPHTLTSTNAHMFSPAHTRTRKKPYAKRRSGLTKQRPDDVTHKPPMGRQLWKRLCAERVNVFQTVLSNTHTQIPHTRKNTHRHTSAGAATPRGVDFAMDTHTSKNSLCCNAATSD